MPRYLVDENGELLGEYGDDELLIKYNYGNLQRNKIRNKMFYKLYRDGVLIFTNDSIKYNTFKTLFKLIRLLEFDKSEFVCLNGIPANIKQLCLYLDMNNKTFYNHLNALEKLEIVKKVKSGRATNILINPYFIGYAEKNTDEGLRVFGNSVWAKNSNYKKNKRRK